MEGPEKIGCPNIRCKLTPAFAARESGVVDLAVPNVTQ